MADIDAKQSAINALTKAANEKLNQSVKDLYGQLITARKAVATLEGKIDAAIEDNKAELAAISGK